jgi:hypothetical protein
MSDRVEQLVAENRMLASTLKKALQNADEYRQTLQTCRERAGVLKEALRELVYVARASNDVRIECRCSGAQFWEAVEAAEKALVG